jgi:hypothetical protein
MSTKENHEYDIKCRKCGEITKMSFGAKEKVTYADFSKWASDHSTFPFRKECICDESMKMFHDLVSIN